MAFKVKFGRNQGRVQGGLTLMNWWSLWKLRKDKVMIDKLKSRKFWVTFFGSTLVLLGNQLGLDPVLLDKVVNLLIGYVVVQGTVDSVQTYKN